MEKKYFRGRKVHVGTRYPMVWWPEHPATTEHTGKISIHRIIAYEKYGELPEGYDVHHKDGDVWNWSPENLELVSASEHAAMHNKPIPRVDKKCGYCGEKFEIRVDKFDGQDYCSLSCANFARQDVDWPPVETVQAMVKEVGFTQTGRNLGVSDNAVRKFLKRNTGA